MIDFEKCKNEFIKYTEKFDLTQVGLKRKQLHSLRVMEKSKEIAQSLNLKEDEVEVATLIGLLHDIGRFEQYTRFHTFSDHNSIDHAELGVEILKKDDYIKNYFYDEKWMKIIYVAISNHNKYKIEEGLNPKEEIFCKIIRDADKADILYEGANLFWVTDAEKESIENAELKDVEIEAINEHKLIDKRLLNKANELDSVLVMLCFIFDVNYPKTFEIIERDDIINKLIGRFDYKKSDTNEKMKKINQEINNYIMKREKTV